MGRSPNRRKGPLPTESAVCLGREPAPCVDWVRHPVRQLMNRLLYVLIYARYSTQEQNPRSIDAQIEFCRRFLEALGITHFKIEVL